MSYERTRWCVLFSGLLIPGAALPAHADGDAPAVAATDNPTRSEFNKLQAEVKDQKKLIIQMMQNEQQRYDMLLRLIQGQQDSAGSGSGAALGSPAAPTAAGPGAAALDPSSARDASPLDGRRPRTATAAETTERKTGVVEGKVSAPSGEAGPIYVYVEGIRASPVRGKKIEIRQEGRKFVPAVAVVQPGTSVSFPNFDSIYHNVFSTSPKNTFDLGSYRAGEKARAVTLASPGLVEVFCNIHQKMSANILVVPNSLYTQVRPNGTFRLNGVPVGQRSVVAWSPHSKPIQQKIEVTTAGAQVSFVLDKQEAKAHVNKVGQAYGSYRD
jgi:plastocyanin